MNRTTLVLAVAALLSATVAATLIPEETVVSSFPIDMPLDGGEENPGARADYELMLLRDPATGRVPQGIRARELRHAAAIRNRGETGMMRGAPTANIGAWISLGPTNVGGRTRALALDVDDENVMLAGGTTGGMWRSENGGLSWERTTRTHQLPSVTAIAQDVRPGKRHIWYYGTGEFRTNSDRFGNALYSGDGIFKSTDGGRNWTELPSTVSGTPQTLDREFDYVNNIVVDFANTGQDILYAATFGGIMRSTDGGTSWTATLGSLNDGSDFTDVAIAGDGTLYAALSSDGLLNGLFRSKDGISWTEITPQGWGTTWRRVVIAAAPSNPNVVYFLGETPGSGLEIDGSYGFKEYYSLWKYTYGSGDGVGAGGTWEDRSTNLPLSTRAHTFNGLTSYALLLRVAPYSENIVFVGGTNLYRSDDGFRSDKWTVWLGGYNSLGEYRYEGALHPDQHILLFPASGSSLIVGNDGGIYRTDDQFADTVMWSPYVDGYVTTQFYTVSLDHATPGSTMVVGGLQDNGTVTTYMANGTEWWMPIGGDGSFCAVEDGGEAFIGSSQFGRTYRVSLSGNDYARLDPQGGTGYMFVNPFALDPVDNRVLYMSAGARLWRNSDITAIPFGVYDPVTTNWRVIGSVDAGATVSAIGLSTTEPSNRVWFGTTDGRVFRLDNAGSGGGVQNNVTGDDFPKQGFVNCIAVDPRDGDRAIVLFSNYNVQSLFLTTDGGDTWTPISGNLEENPDGTGAGPSCRWASILHGPGGPLYLVGTSTGLYSTRLPSGPDTEWHQEGAGTIGNAMVSMIDVRHQDGYIAVATWGSGMYAGYDIPLGVTGPDDRASGFTLHEPRPNPLGSTGSIEVDLPAGLAGESVAISLYDLSGRSVGHLAEFRGETGRRRVEFNLHDLPHGPPASGSYVLRVEAGGLVRSKRIVVRP